MNEAVQTLEGWYVYHDFRKIDFASWKQVDAGVKEEAMAELQSWLAAKRTDARDRLGSFGVYTVEGHKADVLIVHMRPTLDELYDQKMAFEKTRFADFTKSTYSYISVVELSAYLAKPGVDVDTDPYLQGRLKPILPDKRYVCFYPMNKRRDGGDNWYMLPIEARRDMMKSHGMIGRNYAGKVIQIISGSVGLDDWEWGVTLYSDDPVQFKKLVYEMRFDEASARFGEFGPFYVGRQLTDEDWLQFLV